MLLLSFGLVVLSNPEPGFGQYFSGPEASAMGGAGRAAGGVEGHLLNPASLVHIRNYNVGGLYSFNSVEDVSSGRDVGVNIADGNEEALFRAGFAYINRDSKVPQDRVTEDNYIVSVAGWVLDSLSVGLQGHRWSGKPAYSEETVIYQASAGMLFTPIESLGIGLTAHNILDDHKPSTLRPEIGLGMQYLYEELFRVRLEGVYPTKWNPDQKAILMLGTETLMGYGLRLRMGARLDDVSKKTFGTAGLGWQGPRFSVSYAYEKDVRAKDTFRQTFDLNVGF